MNITSSTASEIDEAKEKESVRAVRYYLMTYNVSKEQIDNLRTSVEGKEQAKDVKGATQILKDLGRDLKYVVDAWGINDVKEVLKGTK